MFAWNLVRRNVTASLRIPNVLTQGDVRPEGSFVFWNSTEMDPRIMNDPVYSLETEDGLLAIPTWSIVMDHEDLFGNEGIHRGDNLDRGWERPASLEMIYPATPRFKGFKGFQMDCGIKNQGGGGLWDDGLYDHKQSFGIRFRREYGNGSLNYPLFEHAPLNPESATDEFDKIVLRAGHNKSWGAAWDNVHTTYTRDQLARDLQIDMSGIGAHGSFVHLYLNGIYWGLYNPSERPDNAFAATYFGGNEEDYFAGKGKGGDTSGVDDRYDYWRNTASKSASLSTLLEYCDIQNHADMVLLSAYAAVGDYPQYYYTIRNNPGGPVSFFNWDYEDAFGGGSRRSSDNPNLGNMGRNTGFNDMWSNNPEYRIHFADRAYRACFNEGALTDARVLEAWNRLCDSIFSAILCESARWGDERIGDQGTRLWGGDEYHNTRLVYSRDGTWTPARDAVSSGTVGKANRLINALRQDGLFPSVNPPLFKDGTDTVSVLRKVVSSGFVLTLQRDGGSGVVYYTADGSDPRAEGGNPRGMRAGESTTLPIHSTTTVKARTLDGDTWSALHEAVFFVHQDFNALRLTEVMYNPRDALMAPGQTIVSITGNAGNLDPGYRDRAMIMFSSDLPEPLTGGDKVTIHGAANPVNNGTFTIAKVVFEGSIGQTRTRKVLLTETLVSESSPGLIGDFLYDGDRFEFIEIKNTSGSEVNLSGVTFSRGLEFTFPDGTSLAPGRFAVLAKNPLDFAFRYPGVVMAGAYQPSALDNGGERLELAFGTDIGYDVINITNMGEERSSITVSSVPPGIGHGDRIGIRLAENYSSNQTFPIESVNGNVVHVGQSLSNEGTGSKALFYDVITSVDYNDRAPWPLSADGGGYSLVSKTSNPVGNQSQSEAWRISAHLNGSPGTDDAPPTDPWFGFSPTTFAVNVHEGEHASSEIFKVWNSGANTLHYFVEVNSDLVSVSPTSGSSSGPDQTETHTIEFNTLGLKAGLYRATITVTDALNPNSFRTIDVNLSVREPAAFIAFNDFSWAIGQIESHITRYTTSDGNGNPSDGSSGLLVDYESGLSTGITLSVSGGNWNGANHTTQGSNADPSTDADGVFGNGKVSGQGVISYGTSPIQISISGIERAMTYALVLFSNRDNYTDRYSTFTLSDIENFTNESSSGAVRSTVSLPDDSVTIIADNTANGYVVRYSRIDPGTDGDLLVTVSGSHPYVNAMMISATPRGIVDVDVDVDRMEDDWEFRYFGSTDNPNGAGNFDFDGDGMSTLAEYIAGSDPTDAASSLKIQGIEVASETEITVSWHSFPGKSYSVFASSDLIHWVSLQSGLISTPPRNSTSVPIENGIQFIKVEQD